MKTKKLQDKTGITNLIIELCQCTELKDIDIATFNKALTEEFINNEKIEQAIESTKFSYLITKTKVYKCLNIKG